MSKRYNLVMTKQMHTDLERIAKDHSTSVATIVKQFIRLGLMVDKAEQKGSSVLVDDGKQINRIIIL